MKIYSPLTLRLADNNQLMVEAYTMPEPINNANMYNGLERIRHESEYNKVWKKWLASKIELPVNEGSKDEFEKVAKKYIINELSKQAKEPTESGIIFFLLKGIDVSELADRIDVRDGCSEGVNCTAHKTGKCIGTIVKRAHLLPEKKEGQDQYSLWNDLLQLLYDNDFEQHTYSDKTIIELLRAKFTITKNP
jgi:hypothetical protein